MASSRKNKHFLAGDFSYIKREMDTLTRKLIQMIFQLIEKLENGEISNDEFIYRVGHLVGAEMKNVCSNSEEDLHEYRLQLFLGGESSEQQVDPIMVFLNDV